MLAADRYFFNVLIYVKNITNVVQNYLLPMTEKAVTTKNIVSRFNSLGFMIIIARLVCFI